MLLYILFLTMIPITIVIQWRKDADTGLSPLVKAMGSFIAFWWGAFLSLALYTIIVFSLLFILPTHSELVTETTVYENGVQTETKKEYEREFNSDSVRYWLKNNYYQVTIPKSETVE